ncbi:hypothetical protein XELAEV_18031805mg [Xenopus laevis]|uniref:Tyr recombinase domain-containing protein n=1 Tax=Xenopus laevis TaxID=8355 RepID=A0A974CPG6_XENLA|nr:hypothetical protein XELAEV_18031805mg [Xenopus laevis]
MLDWVERSVVPSTWARYKKYWEEWFSLDVEFGIAGDDSERNGRLVWVLANAFEGRTSGAGIDKKMAALAFLFKLMGWRDVTKEFIVRQAIKGYKRGKGTVDQRRPITLHILEGLLGVLPQVFGGNGLKVQLFEAQGCNTCPIRCYREYIAVRPQKRGSFLIHNDGSCLSRFQFVAVFKKAMTVLGLAVKDYGSHSFRIGAATEAARWGLGEEMIRKIGRWESNRFKSYERSKVPPNGQQLGFLEEQATVRWLGVGGLCWEEVVPMIIQEAKRVGPPNIILVHAGGNDLARCPMKQLTKNIKRDFVRLWTIFPGVCLLWSEILPRKKWRGARSHGAVDNARIKINKAVSKFVQGQGGVAIRHREFDNPGEFCSVDEVHLNELGMDLFNFNLRDSLGFAWRVWRGMQH